MKKRNVLVLGLSVLSLGVFASCSSKSKDTPTPPAPPAPPTSTEYLQVKQETGLDSDGTTPTGRTIYTYDASGNVIKEQFQNYERREQKFIENGNLTRAYNASGLPTEELSYTNIYAGTPQTPRFRLDRKHTYTYTGGQLTKEEFYNFDLHTNQLVLANEREYTWENGKKKKYVEYVHENGRRREYLNVVYRYENGLEIQENYNGGEDYHSYVHEYRYDTKGRVLEETTKSYTPILDGNNQRTGLREISRYTEKKEYNSLGYVTSEKSKNIRYNDNGQVESTSDRETTYIYSELDSHGYPTKLEIKVKEGNNAPYTAAQSKLENTYAKR